MTTSSETSASAPKLNGILNLDKPAGVTSRDVVNEVTRILPRRTRVGHAGTLDPLATGVLLLCIGSATRLVEHAQKLPKTYRATIRLGARSDTDDADGEVVEVVDAPVADEGRIRAELETQVGLIQQVPPRYSAIKVQGRRAYDLARHGRRVDLKARPVRIDAIEVARYTWPILELEVLCGAGTYIRSIARDLGDRLGCGGLIERLVRTRIGPFGLDEAIDPAGLSAALIAARLHAPLEVLGGLPRRLLSPEEVQKVQYGQALGPTAEEGQPAISGEIALIDSGGNLVALGQADPASGRIQPQRVFAQG